jgi:hypothetical protein
LRKYDCPWTEKTAEEAIRGGSLPCLIYAIENKCPKSIHLVGIAAAKGRIDILRYLEPLELHNLDLAGALVENHVDTIKYLLDKDYPTDKFDWLVTKAIKHSRFDAIKLLFQKNPPNREFHGDVTEHLSLLNKFSTPAYDRYFNLIRREIFISPESVKSRQICEYLTWYLFNYLTEGPALKTNFSRSFAIMEDKFQIHWSTTADIVTRFTIRITT